jgi:hypothetical protein
MAPKSTVDKNTEDAVDSNTIPIPKKRRSTATVKSDNGNSNDIQDDATTTKKRRSTSKKLVVEKDAEGIVDESQESTTTSSTKKEKVAPHQILTERDELPKLWDTNKAISNGSYSKFGEKNFFFENVFISLLTIIS